MHFDETAWVAIAFLIFIGLVWKKASKAITEILDSRSLLIENELKEAKSLKEEALEELRKSLQDQKNISDEAEQIIKHAQNAAKKIREDTNAKCLEIIHRREEQAKQKILAKLILYPTFHTRRNKLNNHQIYILAELRHHTHHLLQMINQNPVF